MARSLAKVIHGWVIRYHRRLGVVCALALVLWGLSGMLHPIMSRLNPAARAPMPPMSKLQAQTALSLPALMQQQGWSHLSQARLMNWQGRNVWQIGLPDQPVRLYADAQTGSLLAEGDQRYAAELARHFIADQQSPIRSIELLTRFDDDYLPVNRLLPVYRVQFDRPDGLRAYVETQPARLAALVDNRKALLGQWFRWLHDWSFLDDLPGLQTVLISLMLGITLLGGLSGLWMYGLKWQKGTLGKHHGPARRWHRRLGLLTALALLFFVITGALHLWLVTPPPRPTLDQTRYPASLLTALPYQVSEGSPALTLTQVQGQACWASTRHTGQGQMGEHHHPATPQPKAEGAWPWQIHCPGSDHPSAHLSTMRVREVAARLSRLPDAQIQGLQLVSRFDDEYGFLNKRLPVVAVQYQSEARDTVYIEPLTGALASHIDRTGRLEAYAFSWLHKFHFLDFAGKDIRDLLNGLFGLGNALVGLLGLWLFLRRYR